MADLPNPAVSSEPSPGDTRDDMFWQRTLKSSIQCTGIGVHTNQRVAITLRPGAPNSGIVFRRMLSGVAIGEVKAIHANVVDTKLCTVLGLGADQRIGTVEHLLAAFAGLAVDNAIVEIEGDEVPVMDGSAAPFVFLIECAGLVPQAAPRRAIQVLKTIAIDDGDRHISIGPAAQFSIDCRISYAHPMISSQRVRFVQSPGTFKAELSRARTFCLEEDVARMREAGLAKGGSLDNAVVIGRSRVLNDDGLRYENECVRHKALDCLGDFYLAGAPMIGAIESVRAGHQLNHRLLGALLDDPSAWRYVGTDGALEPPAVAAKTPLAAIA
jgi:UDP-3-O-[3-hydroxymyristoyl] N-acetylglucosamine deacetylase